MCKMLAVSLAIIAVMFAVSVYFYGLLPEKIATHWNAAGVADGFSTAFFGAFLLPVLSLVFLALLKLLPRIDPLKKNIESFLPRFNFFILVLVAFFAVLHFFVIANALGFVFDVRFVVVPGVSAIFACAGFLMKKAKRNYFIGIRTPWTLASDRVWESTHSVGAKLFFALAIIFLFSLVFPDQFLLLLLVPIISVAVFLFVFSFFEYKRLEK